MKMGLAKVCGFLAISVLTFIPLVDSSAECLADAYDELRTQLCMEDILLKGTFQKAYKGKTPPIIKFKVNQVLKGPSGMKKTISINKGKCHDFPEDPNVNEFIISAYKENGKTICNNELWNIFRWNKDLLNEIMINGCP